MIQDLRYQLKRTKALVTRLHHQLDAAATAIGALHADNNGLRERPAVRGTAVVTLDLTRANREGPPRREAESPYYT